MNDDKKFRDEHGLKIPLNMRTDFGFEPSPGSTLSDYAMAMCGLARSMFWPVRGKFNDVELTASEHSDPTGLICEYFAISEDRRREMEKSVAIQT